MKIGIADRAGIEELCSRTLPMKLAVISDVHSNIFGRRLALNDAQERNVDKYIFTGDLINEFPFGNKVINLIKDLQNDTFSTKK